MKSAVLLASMLAMILVVVPASASVIIDFEQGSLTGGTVSSAGVGTNIPVDDMKVSLDGINYTVYDLYGTGPNGTFDTNGSAEVNFNTATGAFTVVGGVCVSGNDTCTGGAGTLVTSTTLATGTASSANVLNDSSTTLVFTESDTKAATLLAALGIPLNTQFALMSATFNYSGSASPYTVSSVDIQNVGVPEPGSILLLGTVLVGITQVMRRRGKKV